MSEHHHHSGCCGCYVTKGMGRRSFLATMGGTALGVAALNSAAKRAAYAATGPMGPPLKKKELVVQPALTYNISTPREATSWRPWGGLHSEADVKEEIARIEGELKELGDEAEFPIRFKPVAPVTNQEDAGKLRDGDADVMLIYGASGGGDTLEKLISPDRYNLVFVRHKSGPVYLWYEIVHPRLLRKTVDVYGQPGLETCDVVVDEYPALLWRMRALYGLKNTVGSRMVAIGGPSGWGAGGQQAPQIAMDLWKMDLITVSYEDFGPRIVAARSDPERVKRCEAKAQDYLKIPGTELKTDMGFLTRAFVLTEVFEEIMSEMDAQAITVNNCMGTIMPLSETTACMPLSLINDSGALAFCESDFAVIPSGVLLHHIASKPVFLQDPTYPHDGIVTIAHCTAPRKMDGVNMEKAQILTHFESDYGAAPKVEMRIGETVTMIDPDFADKRWIGFRGKVVDNPFLDICRSQTDVTIEGDWRKFVEEMVGFHWMMSYGDYLKETGYALRKLGVGWYNLSDDREIEA